MEYKVDTQHLKENGGQKICILALDEAGRVSCVSRNRNYIAGYILINQTLNIRQDKIIQRKYPIHFYIADSDFFIIIIFKGLWEEYGSNVQ